MSDNISGFFLPNSFNLDQNRVILLFIVFVLSALYLWNSTAHNFPPGPWGYPFVGNLKLLRHRPHLHLTHLREKYGDIFQLRLGKHRTIVVSSFEGIQEGLLKEAHKFCDRPKVFSSHLLCQGDEDAGITFTDISMEYKIKKDFVLRGIDNLCTSNDGLEEVLLSEAEKFVLLLLSFSEPVNPAQMLESTMLRLMLYLVNGKMYQPGDENFLEIWKTFQIRHNIVSDMRGFLPLTKQFNKHHNIEVWERLNMQLEYQRDIVNRHKDCFNPDITSDLTDHMLVMLEQNEDMGLLDQEQLDSLLIETSGAGYQTLAVTLRWLLLYVASFPDVQDKVHKELMSVVGSERLPRLSDQPFLPYTCAVIMETHRLASVMPFLYPHKACDSTTLKDYNIPKDSILLFNVWSLHHDPKYWKQPMKFDPTRFLQNNGSSLYIPDFFLPFGEGIRACPGESIADILLFLFSSHLLYQLQISLPDKVDLEGSYEGYVLAPKPFRIVAGLRDNMESTSHQDVVKSGTVILHVDEEEY